MTMWTLDDRYETMPWDELDAVVFDVGNVLLSYSPEEELEAFFPGETELHEKLMEKIIKTPYWNMMDRGTLTVQQAIGHMTGRDQALEPMIRRFMENWLDFTARSKRAFRRSKAVWRTASACLCSPTIRRNPLQRLKTGSISLACSRERSFLRARGCSSRTRISMNS